MPKKKSKLIFKQRRLPHFIFKFFFRNCKKKMFQLESFYSILGIRLWQTFVVDKFKNITLNFK